jgi:hypothetical protein
LEQKRGCNHKSQCDGTLGLIVHNGLRPYAERGFMYPDFIFIMKWIFILFVLAFVLIVLACIFDMIKESILLSPELKKEAKKMYEERKKSSNMIKKWGTLNSELICPHCQAKGMVHTKHVEIKKGISGAKATGAILTAGVSLLATGLSRKEGQTQAHCENCSSTWIF